MRKSTGLKRLSANRSWQSNFEAQNRPLSFLPHQLHYTFSASLQYNITHPIGISSLIKSIHPHSHNGRRRSRSQARRVNLTLSPAISIPLLTPTNSFSSFLGPWGNLGSQPQKGIIHYGIAQNRLKPLGGVMHAAFFNTWRRARAQVLYVVPPFALAYAAMSWAIER